ncbi:hypothetical protein EWM64_g9734 [Hericium alpestre]|uniref:Protein kinase domain-containing protein n=1 Tax=Hericium alpestre TaxID=135208 RepID=A0A4Y9ZLH4_9AGAM|nr:hypothetical protein EWM64_g9734 [Hericium alpestre]
MGFIGPMPVDEFLNEFMSPHSEPAPQVGDGLEDAGSKEDAFINAVARYGLCPYLELVNTSSDNKDPKHSKPNISMFNRENIIAAGAVQHPLDETEAIHARQRLQTPSSPKKKGSRKAAHDLRMCFPILEMPIQCMLEDDSNDPFTDTGFADTDDSDDEADFLRDTSDADRNLERMTQHLSTQLSAQFRSYSFSILLFPNAYRFIRWDRAGAVVTRHRSLGRDGQYLAEFLWRFNHMSPEQRGWDTTVCAPNRTEAALARTFFESNDVRQHLASIGGDTDVSLTTLHKFHVHDEHTNADHYFVAPPALWSSLAPTGRSTSGYLAYDLQEHRLVYLKDTWRADVPDIQPEGVTYRLLHMHEVPYIAGLVCSGDVADQRTRTQEFKAKPWAIGKMQMVLHIHYRVVLDTIGRPLKTAKSSREICVSIRHAIESHWIAYSKAGILHRDISGGNILITKSKNGVGYEGLLIDWELCKSVSPKAPRRDWRTGTWQFLAAEILMEPRTPHKLRHDLESFFYVLLYHVLRYCRNPLPTLESDMEKVFDSSRWNEQLGTDTGGADKRGVFLGTTFRGKELYPRLRPPIAQLIHQFRSQFWMIYVDEWTPGFSEEACAAYMTFLSSSEGVMDIFDRHLKECDWPADDAGRDNLAKTTKKHSQDRSSMSESLVQSRTKRVRLS